MKIRIQTCVRMLIPATTYRTQTSWYIKLAYCNVWTRKLQFECSLQTNLQNCRHPSLLSTVSNIGSCFRYHEKLWFNELNRWQFNPGMWWEEKWERSKYIKYTSNSWANILLDQECCIWSRPQMALISLQLDSNSSNAHPRTRKKNLPYLWACIWCAVIDDNFVNFTKFPKIFWPFQNLYEEMNWLIGSEDKQLTPPLTSYFI